MFCIAELNLTTLPITSMSVRVMFNFQNEQKLRLDITNNLVCLWLE